MLNIFHLLRIAAKKQVKNQSIKHIEEHISKRFYVKNGELTVLQQKSRILFTKTFPFYKSLKQALDNFGLDYEISLGYHIKTFNHSPVDYYYAHNNLCYTYTSEKLDYSTQFIPKLNVIIHFPKVTLTNRDNKYHTIKDLFVKFSVNIYHKIDMLEGTRTTFHPIEYQKRYRHSHLNASSDISFSYFCLGSDAPISFTKILLEEELTKPNTSWTDTFLFFLNQIKAYLVYESLEGGPYIKISSLTSSNYTIENKIGALQLDRTYNSISNAFNAFYRMQIFHFLKQGNLLFANKVFDVKREVFDRVVFNEDFLNCSAFDNYFKANYIEYTYNNLPVSFESVLNNTEVLLDEYVLFQGKKIYGLIKPETNFDNPDELKINVKQIVKNYVYNKFRSEISSYQI
jgi:hypothetical protein